MLMKIDWSLLPSELLELISKHLTFDPDYVRFRSVCTSWRSSAPKRPLLPWLIGHRKDEKGNPTIFSFVKFSSKGDEILPIPELPESNLFNGMRCVVGSSNGWMALMNPTSLSMVLFNPVTKSTIPLPKPPQDEDGSISDIIFLDPAASLPVGCAALAFCWIRQSFSFCRSVGGGPGAHWIPMHVPNFISQCDSCFFRGRLYLSGHSTVYVCDFGREPSIRQIASLNQASFEYSMISRSHLVESNGDLLLVLACNFSAQFKVLRVELGEQVRLVKVKSLRDRALFVGPKNCFSLSASQFPGSREDSIYYTWVGYLGARLMEKLRVYSLKDGSMYSLKDGSNIFIRDDAVVHHGNWKPFDWFTPNLLAARPLDQAMPVSNKGIGDKRLESQI